MTRPPYLDRRMVGVLMAAFALCVSGCPGPSPKPAVTTKPSPRVAGNRLNVVLVTIDTLRADHLGTYGYSRATSPHLDALARGATLFQQAYTYWPKTPASFVAIMTGRRASQSGFSKTHPMLLDWNPTLASVLQEAGYDTAAAVDNANVAAKLGYAKGFHSYRETWEEEALKTEMDRTRAITETGLRFLKEASPERPFFLWLHYVNPHAPYTPPAPFDTAFLDAKAATGPNLRVVKTTHGGIAEVWAVPGQNRLGYYVAQYDGEIAAVDEQVGRILDGLGASAVKDTTLLVLTSDHGESLGEHDFYFDHGENLFDPSLRIPLIVAMPKGPKPCRSDVLASTLDLLPTILDAVKVSYPPDLAGQSLLPAVGCQEMPERTRLFAQNDRNLVATWDRRFKLVATPKSDGWQRAFYDRATDPAETREVGALRADDLRIHRREMDLFLDRGEREWNHIRAALAKAAGVEPMSPKSCEQLKALGYVAGCK
jgi:arylsulfatase A-like enzyme